ncbi:MAG TPA: Clp protease N-terminal domain-containing protein [Candidatus Xenobia bacterium]|jgi:type II secretory ATPase GspE/PulE/Tfp pilus assembly ATPase PilB-like protein
MNWLNLTDRCIEALLLAQAEARFLGDVEVGTEHILIGLVVGGKTVGAQILAEQGLDQASIRGYLTALRHSVELPSASRQKFSAEAEASVVLAIEEAKLAGAPQVTTDHLFLGLLKQEEGAAARILRGLGLELTAFMQKLRQESNPRPVAQEPALVSGESVLRLLDDLQVALERLVGSLIDALVRNEWSVRWPRLELDEDALPSEAEAYPVSSLVEMILSRGIAARAVQIVLEPRDSTLMIRYVFRGGSSEQVEAPKVFKDILPFNVMRRASLNPMEKGRELQGDMVFAHRGRHHHLRVHSEPIHKGVKLCIQVLNQAA